jgi:hypothetical protein
LTGPYRGCLNKNNIYIITFTTSVQTKMFGQKRFAGRHLLTFESQKLNYFGEKVGPAFWHLSHVRSFFKIPSNFLSLISIIYILFLFNYICIDLFIKIINYINDDCKLNLCFINYDTYMSWSVPMVFDEFDIWAMSGPFSRFLVIFYPLSPRTPF